MTFLNAALLPGVFALSIPLLIHLLHRSRREVVRWGAMHLLEAVVRRQRRRLRIEQWLLLAIRCAIPVLLALGMARPVGQAARQLLAPGGDAKTSTILLLDDSYSMDAARAGGSNFTRARDAAARVLRDLPPGSEAQVVRMSEGGAALLDEPASDPARLAEALDRLDTRGTATVPAALDFAGRVFAAMHEPARHLVVLTDFQRVSFARAEAALLGQAFDRLEALPLPPQLTFWEVGVEVRDNVAVESLDGSRLGAGVGEKIPFRATVRNFGDTNYRDLRVYFKADGRERSITQIALGPRESRQVLFSQAFDTAGSHFVEIVADADPLTADNSFLASIPVRDPVSLLLVNGDPRSEPLKGETAFAEIALQPYGAGRVELGDLIRTAVIFPEALDSTRLAGQGAVILANVRRLSDAQVAALEDFVGNGGGLLVFPGDRTDPDWSNHALVKDGRGLLPLALDGPVEGASAAGIVAERFEHPALELFNDPRNGSLADAQIRKWWRLEAAPGTADAPQATTLARLDTGDPFLVERAYGEGRVIACAVPCDADWSDLPMRPSFLPLMQRLCIHLASAPSPPRNLEVGRPLVAFLPAADSGATAGLRRPDGSTIDLPIVKRGGRGVVEYGSAQQPGLYTLTPPGGIAVHFAVNAPRRESDLARLTDGEIGELAKALGAAVVRSEAEFQALDRRRRFGIEWWRPLLWAVLALCFAEIVVQQRIAGARGG